MQEIFVRKKCEYCKKKMYKYIGTQQFQYKNIYKYVRFIFYV